MDIMSMVVGDVVLIRLNGDLKSRDDISPEFQRQMFDGRNKFVIDFQNARSINSIGLSSLLECKHLAEKSGGSVMLCRLNDDVKRVFQVTRLNEIFDIFDDEDTALAGFIKGLPLIRRESAISRHRN
jgi:anti-sigma B factor antagonist